jgi:6-phosphogluconolactonase (cycloisomerase 2 family)
MIDRRTFSALLAGTFAMPATTWGQKAKANAVLYGNVGPELTLYDIDVDAGTLTKRSSVTLPANVQYVWPHPSRRFLYVVSSDAPSGNSPNRGATHRANALRIDPASGALTAHGEPVSLPSRPIHASVDRSGEYLLTAYNNPSNVTVHRIKADGTLGEPVAQPDKPDAGIFAHQVLATPGNASAILVARGNNPEGGKPEDPGALKVYGFKDGVLSNRTSVQPGNGLGFGPRHLDFHPTLPLVFVSIERQNQIYVYRLAADGGLSKDPLFVKTCLAEPNNARRAQAAGAIHVHPNGRFVYVTNRNSAVDEVDGKKVFAGGENNVAVFSIDEQSGEPTLVQNIDARTNHLRTFSIDPTGRMLVAASILPMTVRQGMGVGTLPAAMVVYRIGSDGKLEFVRKYDVDTAGGPQWWTGIVSLPA